MMKRASFRWYGTIVVLIMPLLMVFSTQAQEGKTFKAEELEQMLAPIALYPDSLLDKARMHPAAAMISGSKAAWSPASRWWPGPLVTGTAV